MKVLLINPPDQLDAMFGVGKVLVQRFEPLGLLYIAAVTRAAGHSVTVIDAYAEDLHLDVLRQRILALEPDVVGISTLTCNGEMVLSLGKWLKESLPRVLVVLGNIHASVYAEQYLKQRACDLVVHGEGEQVFIDILSACTEGRDFQHLAAVSLLREDGTVRSASDWAVVQDISSLPMPARDLVDQGRYGLTSLSNQNYTGTRGKRAKTIVTSRGCPFRCIFCVVHHGLKPRYNGVDQVLDELEHLERDMGTGYVYIQDPLFMGNRQRVLDICQGIQARGLRIKWGCDANVMYLDSELIRAMDSANCYELSLGIESASARDLAVVNKKISPDAVRRAVSEIRANSDILIEGLFILGIPGQTRADALATIRFARELDLDMAQFSIMTPYPGSPLFNELAAAGTLDTGIRGDGSVEASVWKRYSSYVIFTENQPIWVTPTMTAEELVSLQRRAVREFYLRPRQLWRAMKRIHPGNFLQAVRIAGKMFRS